jgi:hypothetical protein
VCASLCVRVREFLNKWCVFCAYLVSPPDLYTHFINPTTLLTHLIRHLL